MSPTPGQPAPPPGGPPVLLVDDEEAVRESLAELLSMRGFSVVPAEDGVEALERLREGLLPCAILLDLWMPRMDGPSFLQHRQRDPQLAAIPVIVVSALNDAPARCANLGVQAFLTKPFPLPALYQLLDDCIKH